MVLTLSIEGYSVRPEGRLVGSEWMLGQRSTRTRAGSQQHTCAHAIT